MVGYGTGFSVPVTGFYQRSYIWGSFVIIQKDTRQTAAAFWSLFMLGGNALLFLGSKYFSVVLAIMYLKYYLQKLFSDEFGGII